MMTQNSFSVPRGPSLRFRSRRTCKLWNWGNIVYRIKAWRFPRLFTCMVFKRLTVCSMYILELPRGCSDDPDSCCASCCSNKGKLSKTPHLSHFTACPTSLHKCGQMGSNGRAFTSCSPSAACWGKREAPLERNLGPEPELSPALHRTDAWREPKRGEPCWAGVPSGAALQNPPCSGQGTHRANSLYCPENHGTSLGSLRCAEHRFPNKEKTVQSYSK